MDLEKSKAVIEIGGILNYYFLEELMGMGFFFRFGGSVWPMKIQELKLIYNPRAKNRSSIYLLNHSR